MSEGPIRVLLVEDDQGDYLLIRALFDELPSGTYRLDRAAAFDEAAAAINRCEHEAYLIDHWLGEQAGLELLVTARAAGCTSPMILLTCQREPEADWLSLQAGADEVLVKRGLDAQTLERVLRSVLTQKRLEEELRQSSLQLEDRVCQRTAELKCLNDALQTEIAERARAEQALRKADRRKDIFLATLAHELRNPLAPLTAAIQLIAAEPQRVDQIKQLTGMMSQQLDQLVRLIDDLVDVSRITSGKLHLRSEPAVVSEFIQAAVDQSRPVIDSMRHALNVSLPPEKLVVQGDKVRLAQIVSNLLINAAKYTPKNGRIDLSAGREAGHLVIAIRDNGIGIAPQMLARIFDLFAQVDSSTTRSRGGLGIGLTIVKTLVEMHGGQIRAASEGAGKGSEFTIRLPLATGAQAAGAAPQPQPGQPAAGAAPLPALKILIVDDNQSAAYLMSRLLQKLGQEVVVADGGQAALAKLREFHPDMVISDVAMPGMTGYDLARQIRGLDLPRQPYLVAVTGYGQESDKQDALAAGFDQHLTKPVGVATLELLVRSRRESRP